LPPPITGRYQARRVVGDGQADLGRRKRTRVIQAVANHENAMALRLQIKDRGEFVFRQLPKAHTAFEDRRPSFAIRGVIARQQVRRERR
jgi:hypothetical protein